MKLKLWIAGGWLLASTLAQAEPFVPTRDDLILERLPRSLATSSDIPLEDTTSQTLASAKRYLLAARESGDLRYLGYAEALLSPWGASSDASAELLLIRATLHQAQHRFDAALDDLSRVLALEPDNAQAWLTQAVVQQVIGNLSESRRSCARLLGLTSTMVIATCSAAASADLERLEHTYRLLTDHLGNATSTPEHRWTLNVLAETAARLGHWDAAETHYGAALALPGEDVYTLAALARLHLERGQPTAVLTLLATAPESDELLLLRARAARAVQNRDWPRLREQVARKVAAIQQRGDDTHPGFVAEAQLHVLDDPEQALSQARAQWQRQREPRDLHLLLSAARAAGEPDAASAGLNWLHHTGFYDQRLQRLLADLERNTEVSG